MLHWYWITFADLPPFSNMGVVAWRGVWFPRHYQEL